MLNIYRASAGSGKTYRLTGDFISLLFSKENERTYRKILAVTFTNKATDEMKSRILKELYALSLGETSGYRTDLMARYSLTADAVDHRARKILIAILHDYSSFSISTIDKFFQQVIRAFAREIGVQGGYNLELDSDTTLQQSIDNLFQDLNLADNKQLLTWLTNFAEERIEQSEGWNPRKDIEGLGKEIFKESYQNKAEETNRKLHDRDFLTAYRAKLRKIQSDFDEKVKAKVTNLLQQIAAAGITPDSFKGGSRSPMKALEKFFVGNYELKDTFVAMSETVENCYAKSTSKTVVAAIESIYNDGFQQGLQQLIEMLRNDIVFYNSAGIILKNINTLGILSDLAMQIKKLTDEQNTMLISDTNMLLNRIIDNSDTPFVYEKTGINIDHFMIDEFQDTSVLQWKNFLPLITNSLAADKFNLVVGDVKQSIYRWRNSDWKLLDQRVLNDFRPEQITEIGLDTNWRSDKNIIAFNNAFFQAAAVLLQHKLNATLEPVLGVYPELEKHTQRILHAYSHLKQEVSTKAGIGQVKMTFIADVETAEEFREESLKRLPAMIENLQERGYQPCDVAILVKTNFEASEVTHTLLQYKSSAEAREGFSYNVMGSEGLLIASASAVRFIISMLKLMLNPSDSISRTILNFEYARAAMQLAANEALQACFTISDETDYYSHLFSIEQNNALQQVKNASVYDLVEKIITLFDLGNWYNETAFVQGFQDAVFKFTSGKNTDIYSFVKWWDTVGNTKSISTPENADAFRVMTIHKSKGLDFKVVIIPFCNWEFSKKGGAFKNILWTEPQHEPFNELPLLPVEYGSKLAQSIFAPQYFDELMHQFIDNLNVAYVAFTRAKHELICMAPTPKKEPESVDKISSLGGLMHSIFSNTADDISELFVYFDPEINTFQLGENTHNNVEEVDEVEKAEQITSYSSSSPTGRLKLRNISTDAWLESQEMTDSKLNLGTIMHEILQNIRTKNDSEVAVKKCIREGKINVAEAEKVRELLTDFWQLPETADWFAETNTVLNEAVILTPGAKLYRPDRVVINGNKAIVIDYKFGEAEKESYSKQVKNYMQLITEMGYQTTGYLSYITLGKTVKVDNV